MTYALLTCPICKKQLKKIDNQHLKKHGLTKEQYLTLYPSGPLGVSPATKELMGSVVKKRGPRSAKTKEKISQTLKSNPPTRTEAQRLASSRNAIIAGKSNIGRKRIVPEQARRNLSKTLKNFYQLHPKEAYDKDSSRYEIQLEHVKNLAIKRRVDSLEKLSKELPTILNSWANDINIITENKRLEVSATCNTCNTIITRQLQTFRKHDFKQTVCHVCYPIFKGSSKQEEQLAIFLSENNLSFNRHVKNIIPNKLELDFYSSELKVGIEFNGLYWHSTAVDYPSDRHRLKYEICRDKGIHLIQIFEDEWVNKQNIVKARLLNLLQQNTNVRKIFARNCKIASVPWNQVSPFLEMHHLQGGLVKTKHNFVLLHEDEIVAAMTFQKRRTLIMNQSNEENSIEMVRFAVKQSVPGAFSKLLKHAIFEIKPRKIYSWADLRWVNPLNNVYVKNGFTVHAESRLGYHYTNFVRRFHRFGRRKPIGEILTEKEWNATLGYYQIFDAGTINYVLNV